MNEWDAVLPGSSLLSFPTIKVLPYDEKARLQIQLQINAIQCEWLNVMEYFCFIENACETFLQQQYEKIVHNGVPNHLLFGIKQNTENKRSEMEEI